MYVCLCHGINESTLRDAVQKGSRTLRELSFQTGCGTQCGSCVPQVRELLSETLATSQANDHVSFLQVAVAS